MDGAAHRPVDPKFWQGKSVFLTGHTGFKGSWLALWLAQMGARVHGYALAPLTDPAMFQALALRDVVTTHQIADLRDRESLTAAVAAAKPDVVIHMAAQPIVSIGYSEPLETFEVNVMGTAALLEACRPITGEIPVLVVSSDKCYLNLDTGRAFTEADPLGGKDPYSASKAATELVVSAWRQSYFKQAGPRLASGRAGNVVGGGDWSLDRLVPDMMRAFSKKQAAVIRNPRATRPWQHVIEPLAGYLVAVQAAAEDRDMARSWNFGPNAGDDAPVGRVVELAQAAWGEGAFHEVVGTAQTWVEAATLGLDCTSAKQSLGWRPIFDLPQTMDMTVAWYRAFYDQTDAAAMQSLTLDQIGSYVAAAAA